MRLYGWLAFLAMLPVTLVAQTADPGRIEQLRASLKPGELTPGVHLGWEGDPRKGSWVTLCDEQGDAKACWLVGIQLTPAVSNRTKSGRVRSSPWFKEGADPIPRSAHDVVAVQYLKRGCDLGAGEACADLGDYYRFRGADEINPYASFDLKQAFSLYQTACTLASAYGCYVFAEFTDRGIATSRDTDLARAKFQELCQSGLAVACLRARAPATAYRYKVFSKSDSNCSDTEECWSECSAGKWGACQRIPAEALNARPPTEVASVRERACAEGSDWGCSLYVLEPCYNYGKCKKQPSAVKAGLTNGCKAGSENACLRACRAPGWPEVEKELGCSTRERTIAGVEFVDTSLEQRMQECFGGGEQGCFDFLTDADVRMTPEQAQAYNGDSAMIFRRMQCNSGYLCNELAESHVNQLRRAYQVSDHVSSYPNDAFFRGMTPMEKALAAEWLMNGTAADLQLPSDTLAGLDDLCNQRVARACRALAKYFHGKSKRVVADPGRKAETDRIQKALKELDESSADRHSRCDVVLGNSSGVDIVKTDRQCHQQIAASQSELRSSLMQNLYLAESTPGATVTDPALRALAEDYRTKARKAGDRFDDLEF